MYQLSSSFGHITICTLFADDTNARFLDSWKAKYVKLIDTCEEIRYSKAF